MTKKYSKVPKFVGVYFYTSSEHKFKSKPDVCFFVRYYNQYGKRQWEKVGWKSEGYSAQFAANVRNERIRSARHGLMPETQKNITFADIWKKYDQWLDSGRSRPEDDRQRYRDHVKPMLENLPVNSISPATLEDLKAQLFKKGLAPATVKHSLVVVRQVINKAKAWDLWSGENPVSKIKLPHVENRRERFLSQKEAKLLLNELQKQSVQTYHMAILSLETGMRAGEICAIQWEDIDFNNRIINIRGKAGYNRQAYITDEMMKIFKTQTENPSGYVFKSKVGGPVKEISKSFVRAAKRIGLNRKGMTAKQLVSFHTLRHTFASWLAISGTPLYTIKELMGHKSIEMTMRYSHLCPDHKREAIAKISGRWSADESGQETPQDPESDTESGDQPWNKQGQSF